MTEGGVHFSEMIDVCSSEASRIEIVQGDLVASGLRTAPDPGQLRRMRVFEAIIHMIDFVRGDEVILGRLKKKTASSFRSHEAQRNASDTNRGSEVSNRVAGSGAG